MMLPSSVRPSLVRTITLRLAITSLLALLLQLVIVVARTYLDEDDLNRSYVTREARTLLRGVHYGAKGLQLKRSSIPSHYLGAQSGAYAFRIMGDDGKTIAERNGSTLAEISPWPERPSRTQDLWLLDLDLDRKLYVAGGLRQKIAGRDVWVEVATRGDPEREYLGIVAAEVLDDVWMPMIPLVVLTLGVAVISVRRSLAGLVRAATQAEGMSPLDRSKRFDISGMPREAAIFAMAINSLLDRVGNLVQAHRMLVARAAHELRTPLSVMTLELGRKEPRVERLEADVRAMSDTVDRLLTLARLESIEAPETRDLDVGQIASEMVDHLKDWASKTNHRVSLKVCDPACVSGDAAAIREALRNLIENAIRHTPSGTEIQVTVGPAGSIVVEDNGPGFATHEISELLQPFKKGRDSGEGAGLGLAIVKQAIDLHHGRIEVGRSSAGGAKFSLTFPQHQPAGA
jgi:signal transduction histidine kinase